MTTSTAAPPRVSVVICAYTELRWQHIQEAIQSVEAQEPRPDEILLVVDHNPELLARAERAFPEVRVVANRETRGLSGARNTGVAGSDGDVVVFLDDDAVAEPGWLAALLEPFAVPDVIGSGGWAEPIWEGGQPRWFPGEFLWTIGASWTGMPARRERVRNPMGGTMAFRREAFEHAGGFAAGIGRVGQSPTGCEETEFAIRVQQTLPGTYVLHVPEARIRHHVPAARTTWNYFVRRCWSEGISKAQVARRVGLGAGLAAERAYASRTLPLGVLRGLRDSLRGDPHGIARAAGIVVGLLTATAGYIRGQLG